MLIELLLIAFLQIFCKIMTNSKVIFKSIKVQDDFCQQGLQAWKGWLTHSCLKMQYLSKINNNVTIFFLSTHACIFLLIALFCKSNQVGKEIFHYHTFAGKTGNTKKFLGVSLANSMDLRLSLSHIC